MKKYVYIALLSWGCLGTVQAQTWNLVWSDEFTGTAINTQNWVFETGNNNGWGNNELEFYTKRVENATVQNDNLLIIARKESFGGFNYTSARMKTQGKQSWTYGKVEANIKIPVGQGIWPAFWMLGANYPATPWPACGEIDIMEHIDSDNVLYGTYHWQSNGNQADHGLHTTFDVTKYHVFGLEWDSLALQCTLDGTPYVTMNIANNAGNTQAFHKPFFILLNVAVGGGWPGNPDANTVFPDTMFVDYVRVYQKSFPTDVQENVLANAGMSVSPNPSKTNSLLRYTVGSGSSVHLSLYDGLGKEVMTLVNENQASGEHALALPMEELSRGMYVIKGNVGDRTVFYKVLKE
jgi:beta-glucanase (GH16 family)